MNYGNDKIHGTKYYTAGRNGYTCIDNTIGDSSGGDTLISGIRSEKGARETCAAINRVQTETLLQCAMVYLTDGHSAHSLDLYLTVTNDGKLYESIFKSIQSDIRKFMQNYSVKGKLDGSRLGVHGLAELRSIIQSTAYAFTIGLEKYEKEFSNMQKERKVFTHLDVYTAAMAYINLHIHEFEANGLE